MGKKDGKHSNSDDIALFRAAVADVRPIGGRNRHPTPKPATPAIAASRKRDERDVLEESLGPPPPQADIETGDELLYKRESVQHATFRKLRRGQYAIQDEIDLHRLRSDEAHAYLRDFLKQSIQKGHRCVRVIHGKGHGSGARGPVLKHGVNQWLRRWDEVLAFSSARGNHGGTGAIYVLLRKA